MSFQIRYKIIAAFLLMVFSLNTVAGFACSVGIDMGYNTKHHAHEHPNLAAHDAEGQQRDHQKNAGSRCDHGDDKNDCCTHDVAKFIQLDKLISNNPLALQAPVFLFIFTSGYLAQATGPHQCAFHSGFRWLRRSCSLNDTDIRIAIQSFQI